MKDDETIDLTDYNRASFMNQDDSSDNKNPVVTNSENDSPVVILDDSQRLVKDTFTS